MTCKDCIHCEACERMISDTSKMFKVLLSEILKMNCDIKYDSTNILSGAEICQCFQDRSRFVEMPYPIKPHDKVWYILEGLSEIDLKDYEITKGDCAVGNNPDTVIEVGTLGFWVNQLSERNEDYLVPDDCDFISWDEIGKSYFLTKESAEQALKEREKNGHGNDDLGSY